MFVCVFIGLYSFKMFALGLYWFIFFLNVSFVCVGICFLSKCFLFVWFGKSWMGQTEDSVLQLCQLTELKQTKEWEMYPNRFQRLYETLLPENLAKHCREWPAGKTESEIKLLIQENSKPQDLIVYTDDSVTKDQSGWGFTVKQGATIIHEDSAVYTVSTFTLTMEMESEVVKR